MPIPQPCRNDRRNSIRHRDYAGPGPSQGKSRRGLIKSQRPTTFWTSMLMHFDAGALDAPRPDDLIEDAMV